MFCHVQFCTLNVHINICFCMVFCNAHLCKNDYPYSYGFPSWTSLYKLLSMLFLYGFRHVHLCTNDYPYFMGFRHAHFCTKDYPFLLNGFSSCIFLYKWLPFLFELVFVMHISVWRTIHIFLTGFSSCTFLYEWLSISFFIGFRHAHFCANDYPFLCVWYHG